MAILSCLQWILDEVFFKMLRLHHYSFLLIGSWGRGKDGENVGDFMNALYVFHHKIGPHHYMTQIVISMQKIAFD